LIQKILGQSTPASTTDTTIYTVPTSCQAQCSVLIANRTTSNDKFRIAIVPQGSTLDNKHYIAYDVSITPGQFVQVSEIYINTGDFIVVRSENGNVSFSVTGMEMNRSRMRVLT